MTAVILITRPKISAERFCATLERLGLTCFVEPLLTIEATSAPRPGGFFQATMITSSSVFEVLHARKDALRDLLPLPCFCVGRATGDAAQMFGFTNVRTGTADSMELAQMVSQSLTSKEAPILHVAGEIVDVKGTDMLTAVGFHVATWTVYRAQPVENFTASLHALFLSQTIAVHPVFSSRTARVLVELVKRNHLERACSNVTAIALSQAVRDVLEELPWKRLLCARQPSEESVVSCLQTEMSMNDFVLPVLQPEKRKRRSGTILLVLAVVLVLSALWAWWKRDVHTEFSNATTKVSQTEPLEKRVDTIETRVKTLTEIPAVESASENDALSQTVQSLQIQVAALQAGSDHGQRAARKWAAAAIAFDRLNAAAENGRPFASQLELLHHAVVGDPVLEEAVGKLDSFAHEPVAPWSKLQDDLVAQQASFGAEEDLTASPTILGRIRAVFHPLITIHALRDVHFTELQEGVVMHDETAADATFDQLPAPLQGKLASWKRDLDARMHLDDALDHLALVLETVPDQGDVP